MLRENAWASNEDEASLKIHHIARARAEGALSRAAARHDGEVEWKETLGETTGGGKKEGTG